jgi:hypothetical protein
MMRWLGAALTLALATSGEAAVPQRFDFVCTGTARRPDNAGPPKILPWSGRLRIDRDHNLFCMEPCQRSLLAVAMSDSGAILTDTEHGGYISGVHWENNNLAYDQLNARPGDPDVLTINARCVTAPFSGLPGE